MVKAKTSGKQKTLRSKTKLKDDERLIIREHDPFKFLLNEENLARAIRECLDNNDPEGLIEVIEIYLDALEKSKFLKNADIPRATGQLSFAPRVGMKTHIKVVRMSEPAALKPLPSKNVS